MKMQNGQRQIPSRIMSFVAITDRNIYYKNTQNGNSDFNIYTAKN